MLTMYQAYLLLSFLGLPVYDVIDVTGHIIVYILPVSLLEQIYWRVAQRTELQNLVVDLGLFRSERLDENCVYAIIGKRRTFSF